MTSGEMRAAATKYAAHDWPVFPLWPIVNGRCGCPDPACRPDSMGKHPISKGWQNSIASVSAAETAWADRLGARGIGLACGARAGVWVLDVDPRHGGDLRLAELEHANGPLPLTLRAATGGGGEHVYFAWRDGGPPITNSPGGLPTGLDVRGHGGFVVLPPTLHPSGQRYRWQPGGRVPAPAPAWLLDLVRAKARPRATAAQQVGLLAGAPDGDGPLVPPGRRHFALVRFLGLLRSMGMSEAALVAHTHAFLKHSCADTDPDRPTDYRLAESTARSIARSYPPHVNREDER